MKEKYLYLVFCFKKLLKIYLNCDRQKLSSKICDILICLYQTKKLSFNIFATAVLLSMTPWHILSCHVFRISTLVKTLGKMMPQHDEFMLIKIYSPAITKRKNSIVWNMVNFWIFSFFKWILCNTEFKWRWTGGGLENILKINHWGGSNKRGGKGLENTKHRISRNNFQTFFP